MADQPDPAPSSEAERTTTPPSPSTAEDQAPHEAAEAAGDTDTPGTAGEGPPPTEEPDAPASPPSGAGRDLELHARPDITPVGMMPSEAEWSNLMSMAKVISTSGLAPKVNGRPMTPEAVAVTALKGRELGIPPMQALSQIHVIEGRPTASAELMRALVQRSGHYLAIVEQTAERAVAVGRRRDWPASVEPVQVAYTFEEATQAGITGKSNWKKHPTDMLVARATSRLCRQIFADCLMGASYLPDELDAEVDYTVEGEIAVTIERDQPAPRERPADDGTPITAGQKTKLAILVKDLGIRSDDSDVLYRAGMMASYGVDSIKDLTRHQASTLIEVFETGAVDRETGEVTRSPEEIAKAFLEKGSKWLAEQERAESEGKHHVDCDIPNGGDTCTCPGVELDENGEPIVDAEVVDDGEEA